MKATTDNGDVIQVKSSAIDYALRIGLIVVSLAMAYGVLWLKVNAPTREEFNRLNDSVQGLRGDMSLGQEQLKRLIAHEERIRQLEREFDRMFPNRRRQNE